MIQSISFMGRVCFTSSEVASLLGISREILMSTFEQRKAKFTEGVDFIILTGDDLARFKRQKRKETGEGLKHTSKLTIFFEPGLKKCAMQTNTDEALRILEVD